MHLGTYFNQSTVKIYVSSPSLAIQPFLSHSIPYKILPDLLDHPVFTSLDFATVIFLQSKVVSLASNPQPGGPGLCIYVPQ
jgi:hypothetical protein